MQEEKAFTRNRPKTVAELIDELRRFPPDTRVVVSGYEGGVGDCWTPELISIRLNANDDELWFNGPHEKLYPYEKRAAAAGEVAAVYLGMAGREGDD